MEIVSKEIVEIIGEVAHRNVLVHDYSYALTVQIDTEINFKNQFDEFKQGSRNPFLFVSLGIVKNCFDFEYLVFLETQGINLTAFSPKNQLGSYALNYFQEQSIDETIIVRFSKWEHDDFRLLTRQQQGNLQDEVGTHPFKNRFTSTQVIGYCKKTSASTFEWSAPLVMPDGMHCLPPLTSTDQYAQSCFEGMITMSGSNGELILIRPRENARRFRKSAIAIGIPPIHEQVFLDSVKAVILANKDFCPTQNDTHKLYIRPYLRSVSGGHHIGLAESYLFCIQVFPIASITRENNEGLHLIAFHGKKRSHDGGMGCLKVSGNYAQTIIDRERAKGGINGKNFDEVFYMGDRIIGTDENGSSITREVIEEAATGNLFFLNVESENRISFCTPPLHRHSILGGFTRDTLIKILTKKRFEVLENELEFTDLEQFNGAFLCGSAVGMAKIKTLNYNGHEVSFYPNELTESVFETISKEFYEIRRGSSKLLAESADSSLKLYEWEDLSKGFTQLNYSTEN